jgi:hypothetical protein
MARLAAGPLFADDPVICCLPCHKNASRFFHPRLDGRTLFETSVTIALCPFIVAVTAAVEHERHQSASNQEGEEHAKAERDPPVDAHLRVCALPGANHEGHGHRQQ